MLPEKDIERVYVMHQGYSDGILCHVRVIYTDETEHQCIISPEVAATTYPEANPKVEYLTKLHRPRRLS